MLQISQYLLDQNPIQDLNETNQSINWLLPLPENNSQNQIESIINIPEQLSTSILSQTEQNNELEFFQNDVRALQKYASILPSENILSLSKKDQESTVQEFNQFFKQNYVNNQAFLLDPKDEEDYQDFILQNGFMTWHDFVIQRLNQKIQPSKKEEYNLQKFLQKTPQEREKQLLPQPQDDIPNIQKLNNSNLKQQEDILKNYEVQEAKTSIQQVAPYFNESIQNKEPKEEYSQQLTQGAFTQNTEYNLIPDYSSIKPNLLIPEKQEDKSQNQSSSFKKQFQTPSIAQVANQATKTRLERASNSFKSDSKSRQKGVNYAKIIGLASGGTLAGFSSLATMLSILTSSS